ncbi:hypothetical protein LGH70_23460, partial [Hymenobacter sp. BT635]
GFGSFPGKLHFCTPNSNGGGRTPGGEYGTKDFLPGVWKRKRKLLTFAARFERKGVNRKEKSFSPWVWKEGKHGVTFAARFNWKGQAPHRYELLTEK